MKSTQILNGLEREKELLEDFICLSEEQLLYLADEDLDGFDKLLQRRLDLMTDLMTIEATLANWISQIRNDPSVSPQNMTQIRVINDEIVCMANHVVQIDEHAHARLDTIKQKTGAELRSIERGRRALRQYASTYTPPKPDLDVTG